MQIVIDIDEKDFEFIKSVRRIMKNSDIFQRIATDLIKAVKSGEVAERPQGDKCMTNVCCKKQNAKCCNTCLHYQQLTKIQEIGYCEMKNYHVSANSNNCINYKEKQKGGVK